MFVIGTAGHVDHGKSTLVEVLTGIDPDRLKEEKLREMTIDLGFAWVKLDGMPEEIGFVDVPGHRDFIENMLAGIGGIDLALLVIAADEGVMPQTAEHLAILDLLEVKGGVVALSKIDLIDDPEWLELIALETLEILANTALDGAPVIPVSARTGKGLDELKRAIVECLLRTEPRPNLGRPRLPIDRVFSQPGFGTIVTGTLIDGELKLGQAVELQPAGRAARIRGLQTHRTKVEVARPGSRVAVNLSGANTEAIARGDVLAAPGAVAGTLLCDVHYRHLLEPGLPLKHNVEVKMFVGSAEVMARTRVLGSRQIDPGSEGWLQLALNRPVAVAGGDRYILRRPSPATTIGGGWILDPHPGRRHRRFSPEVMTRLEALAKGSPGEILLQAIASHEPAALEDIASRSGLESEVAAAAWEQLMEEGRVRMLGDQVLAHDTWQRLMQKTLSNLEAFHLQFPLRVGMPKEELRSRLRLTGAVYSRFLEEMAAEEEVVIDQAYVRLPGHAIRFSSAQSERIERLISRMADSGVNSPSVKETKAIVGDDVYYALIELAQLRQISDDVVYTTSEYESIVARIESYLRDHRQISAAQLRDLLGTSRKYAIALLEHLDELRITRRVGDNRVLAG